MKTKSRPPSNLDDSLLPLFESVRFDSPKGAIRRLKSARRAIKHEIHRIRKNRDRFQRLARVLDAPIPPADAGSRRLRIVNGRPSAMEADALSPANFHPPDPGIIRRIMADGAPLARDAAPAMPDDLDEDDADLLVLPALTPPSGENDSAATEPPPPPDGADCPGAADSPAPAISPTP